MAVLGVSLYSAGIAILLGSVYAFKFIRIENYLTKLVLHLSAWLKIGPGKLDLQNQLPIQTTKTVPEASEYTSSWWTDEKQFQLERRAIFSKVGNFFLDFFFFFFGILELIQLMNFHTELVICDPCFKVSEAG